MIFSSLVIAIIIIKLVIEKRYLKLRILIISNYVIFKIKIYII